MRLFEALSEREEEVLRLVALGHTNKDIAGRLSISVFTVQNHVQHLLARLSLRNRTEAAYRYWERLNQEPGNKNS